MGSRPPTRLWVPKHHSTEQLLDNFRVTGLPDAGVAGRARGRFLFKQYLKDAFFGISFTGLCLVIILMLYVALKNPGVVPRIVSRGSPQRRNNDRSGIPYKSREYTDTAVNLYVTGSTPLRLKFCRSCNIFRPPRTSHCKTCNRCVVGYDHHCSLLGTCIGKNNYRPFLVFLASGSGFIIWIFYTIVRMFLADKSDCPDIFRYMILGSLIFVFIVNVIVDFCLI